MSVKGWDQIEEPLLEIEGLLDVVLDKVNILDILDKWGIEYAACRTGEFTHRMKCPFPLHAFGDERTASFFVSEEQNKFYCFGCNSGGNVIDMVRLYAGKPFYESAKWLAQIAGVTDGNIDEEDLSGISRSKKRDPEQKVSTHVFRAGVEIRNFLNSIKGKKEYNEWKNWADKRFAKLDKYLDQLEDDDWKIAKDYYDKIVQYLKRKQYENRNYR